MMSEPNIKMRLAWFTGWITRSPSLVERLSACTGVPAAWVVPASTGTSGAAARPARTVRRSGIENSSSGRRQDRGRAVGSGVTASLGGKKGRLVAKPPIVEVPGGCGRRQRQCRPIDIGAGGLATHNDFNLPADVFGAFEEIETVEIGSCQIGEQEPGSG